MKFRPGYMVTQTRSDGSVNVSDSSEKPNRGTRAEFAREARLPERKLRAAAEP
jgi:hypothetical protein